MIPKKEFHLSHVDSGGLTYLFCGSHDCPSGYAYGPMVRDEYVLHFVNRGTGLYRINKTTFPVSGGSSFVLFPGYILQYQADRTDPWEYFWVAFGGQRARHLLESLGVSPTEPVITHRNPETVRRLFQELLANVQEKSLCADFVALSLFHQLFAEVARDAEVGREAEVQTSTSPKPVPGPVEEPIQKAIAFIQENYSEHDLSVETIASHVCLERTYFSTLFKEQVGTSPGSFVLNVRMENACRMLSDSAKPVKLVAIEVGFHDQGYFDKVFRKHMNVNPSEYRLKVTQEQAGTGPSFDSTQELDRSFFS
ncbi:MAG: AraC family transcriptional regulator [Spirochaetales bacterium]